MHFVPIITNHYNLQRFQRVHVFAITARATISMRVIFVLYISYMTKWLYWAWSIACNHAKVKRE